MPTELLLPFFRRVKKRLLRSGEYLYRAMLLCLHALDRPSRAVRPTILVTGDVGDNNGPYTFLRVFVKEMSADSDVVLCFARNQIHHELRSLCDEYHVRLIARPVQNDVLDIIFLSILDRLLKPAYVVVNAICLGRHLHYLCLQHRVLYVSHSIWQLTLSDREYWTLDTFLTHRHRVVTVSKAAYQAMADFCFSKMNRLSNLAWIHNGIEDRRKEERGDSGRIIVLTLGTVSWFKNPDLWLKVAERIVQGGETPNLEFWWVGDGDKLKELQQRTSHHSSIKFLGPTRHADQFLSQASIYLQLSKFESFGYGICEAMMHGLPSVVTDSGGPAELQVNKTTGFIVSEDDEEGISQRLRDLIRDPELRRVMGRNARERYTQRFTADQWKRNWVSLVHESHD